MSATVVLDASAILAAVLGERGGEVIVETMKQCIASTVNMAEVRSRLFDRGHGFEEIEASLRLLKIEEVDFTRNQSIDSGKLRPSTRNAGLSLGDRACLALALERNAVALTADRQWAALALPIEVQLIR